ncbi:MAG: hypothetical protein HOG49_10680 [Candidatus Scalindua sp.]|jgi:hypothetical protein|nr:hypothetical protein [Candidatus Scalindua sp.]
MASIDWESDFKIEDELQELLELKDNECTLIDIQEILEDEFDIDQDDFERYYKTFSGDRALFLESVETLLNSGLSDEIEDLIYGQ